MAQSLLHLAVARQPHVSFPITVWIYLPLAIEQLEDDFSSGVQFSGISTHHRSSDATWRPSMCVYEDFTLTELKHVLKQCRPQGAPGPDGVTNQALKHVDNEFHPLILDTYRNI